MISPKSQGWNGDHTPQAAALRNSNPAVTPVSSQLGRVSTQVTMTAKRTAVIIEALLPTEWVKRARFSF